MAVAAGAVADRLVEDARLAVAAEVRSLMGRHRMTQTRLADLLEMSQATISRRLTGEVAFDVDDLVRMSVVFGVNPDDFVCSLRGVGMTAARYSVIPGEQRLPGLELASSQPESAVSKRRQWGNPVLSVVKDSVTLCEV